MIWNSYAYWIVFYFLCCWLLLLTSLICLYYLNAFMIFFLRIETGLASHLLDMDYTLFDFEISNDILRFIFIFIFDKNDILRLNKRQGASSLYIVFLANSKATNFDTLQDIPFFFFFFWTSKIYIPFLIDNYFPIYNYCDNPKKPKKIDHTSL